MTFRHTDTDHPLENEYPKLIRDKIPEIIKQTKGNDVSLRMLADDQEFLSYLLKKVVEEAEELSQADTDTNLKEEIADIYETIDALIKMKSFSVAEILNIQSEKREKRGGFEKRLLMLKKASNY